MSPIITLLTDYGCRDHYAGVMKGVILSINSSANIIDISHAVAPQNVFQGAFFLKQAYPYFPPGTIHVAVVDPGVGTNRKPIAVEGDDRYFVGPDNGIFGLILNDLNTFNIYEITNPRFFRLPVSTTFHGRDIFAPVAAHLSLGLPPDRLGPRQTAFQRLSIPVPVLDRGILTGAVIHVDGFGNVITNISGRSFPACLDLRCLRIRAAGVCIVGICGSYEEVAPGEPLALVGSSGLLELSIREGNASAAWGLQEGHQVIVF